MSATKGDSLYYTLNKNIPRKDLSPKQKKEIEEEIQVKQKILTEVSEIIEEFDKLPIPPKEDEPVAEPGVGDQPVPSEEAPVDEPAPEE